MLAWCVGILIVAYIFAMVIYRRTISSPMPGDTVRNFSTN